MSLYILSTIFRLARSGGSSNVTISISQLWLPLSLCFDLFSPTVQSSNFTFYQHCDLKADWTDWTIRPISKDWTSLSHMTILMNQSLRSGWRGSLIGWEQVMGPSYSQIFYKNDHNKYSLNIHAFGLDSLTLTLSLVAWPVLANEMIAIVTQAETCKSLCLWPVLAYCSLKTKNQMDM